MARAAGAAAVLLLLTVGVPVAMLAAVGPWGPESSVAGFGRWVRLETPLSGGAVRDVVAGRAPLPTDWLVALLLMVMWILWAQIVWAVLIEGWSIARGRMAPRALTMPGVQQAVARLIASVTVASSLSVRLASAGPLLPVDDSAMLADASESDTGTVAAAERRRLRSTGADDPVLSSVDAARRTTLSNVRPVSVTVPVPVSGMPTVQSPQAVATSWAPTYHVTVPGDTLWDLSERLLGSGMRWRDLRDANLGRQMPDGTTISSTTERLHPNWPLVIPTEGSSPEPAVHQVVEGDTVHRVVEGDTVHRVVEGDTLWSVARNDLLTDADASADGTGGRPADASVAERVGELIELNQLETPDLLVPGQILRLTPAADVGDSNSAGSGRSLAPTDPVALLAAAEAATPTAAPAPPEVPVPPVHPELQLLAVDDLDSELQSRVDPRAEGERGDDETLPLASPAAEPMASPAVEPMASPAVEPVTVPMSLEGSGSDGEGRDWRSISLGLAAISLVAGYLHLARQARRLSSLRARRTGQRPEPMVEHHRAPTRRLTAAADTGNHDLLLTTIRSLGAVLVGDDPSRLPQFWGAFVGADGLFLGLDPSSPHRSVPRPFRELRDGSGWVVDREDLPALAERGRGANGALPLLSTLGSIAAEDIDQATDRRGRPLMSELFEQSESVVCAVDLEAVRVLGVDAVTAAEATAALAAVVVELATSPLADEMEIVLVGFDAGVQSFTRVRAVRSLGEVMPYLKEVTRRAELQQDIGGPFATRAVNGAIDTWKPVVVVLGPDIEQGWGSASEVASILELARRTEGGVTVLCGFDTGLDPTLRIRGQAVTFGWLPAPWTDRRFHRPDLDPSVIGDVLRDPRPGQPLDDDFWNPDRVDFNEPHPASFDQLEAVLTDQPEMATLGQPETVPLDQPEAVLTDQPEAVLTDQPEAGAGTWSAEPIRLVKAPAAGMAGPVRVSVLDGFTIGGYPIGDRTKPWKYSKTPELVLYLLLHPAGVSQDTLMEALFPFQAPNRSRLNQLVSDARTKALGADEQGQLFLPHAAAGDPFYRLEPGVLFDLREFAGHCATARDTKDSAAEIDAWVAALELVKSRPFPLPTEGFGWAAPEVEATIVKVEEAAVALADLAMDDDDPALAVWATRKGLLTGTSYDELLTRRGRAALALGDPEEVVRAQADIRNALDLDWSEGPTSFGEDLGPSAELTEVHARLAETGRSSGRRR